MIAATVTAQGHSQHGGWHSSGSMNEGKTAAAAFVIMTRLGAVLVVVIVVAVAVVVSSSQ